MSKLKYFIVVTMDKGSEKVRVCEYVYGETHVEMRGTRVATKMPKEFMAYTADIMTPAVKKNRSTAGTRPSIKYKMDTNRSCISKGWVSYF